MMLAQTSQRAAHALLLGSALMCEMWAVETPEASAMTVPYQSTLAGFSSAAVYDASGTVVRELQHAEAQPAGKYALTWDGRDRDGKAMPPGVYTWRRLQTPGLSTTWLMNVGSSYPPNAKGESAIGPGTHQSPGAVAVDASGVYISAHTTENIETCMLKMSPDGKQTIWGTGHPSPWDGAVSLAADGGEVFMLGHTLANGDERIDPSQRRKQMVFVYDAATGAFAARTVANTAVGHLPMLFDVQWDAQGKDIDGTDMDVRDGVMCVIYDKRNALRWYDTKDGTLLGEATIPAPQGVTLGPQGVAYVSTGDTIVSISKNSKTPVVVAKDLLQPSRLSCDPRSNELLVLLSQTQQIVRLSSIGKLLTTYGEKGGRPLGLYDAKAQRSFAGVSDVCADGAGGFYVTEAHAPPRRTTHIGANGAVIREWYGGQRWAPHATPEGDDASALWVSSGYGAVMRVLVDYTKKTWTVHSTYSYSNLADGLVGESHNEGSFYRVFNHAGATYLALAKSPTVLKLDEKTWQLKPVTVCGVTDRATQAIKDWATPGTVSFQWNDANADGMPQRDEVTYYPEPVASSWMATASADLSYVSGFQDAVWRFPVSSWNAIGAPIYGSFPHGERFGPLPARMKIGTAYNDARWALFLHRDAPTGRIYAGINPGTTGWCASPDTFLQSWNTDGTLAWAVGQAGSKPGEFGNLRGIAGLTHGCVVSVDVDGSWNPSYLARTYVHDENGLFVGGIMDRPDLKGVQRDNYRLSGELCHATIHDLPNGDVLFYANWENEMRMYRVSGWKEWIRSSGTITLKAAATKHVSLDQ